MSMLGVSVLQTVRTRPVDPPVLLLAAVAFLLFRAGRAVTPGRLK